MTPKDLHSLSRGPMIAVCLLVLVLVFLPLIFKGLMLAFTAAAIVGLITALVKLSTYCQETAKAKENEGKDADLFPTKPAGEIVARISKNRDAA